MALECTHIRFAVELKDKFGVKDLGKYISGTVYPDSRYITRIERGLTHNPDYINSDFYQDDDFKRGWVVHLICDKLQHVIMAQDFAELVGEDKGKIKQGNELWVIKTALKILQDINDFDNYNLQDYLDYLKYVETPNNEAKKVMREYNQIFINTYKNKKKIIIADEIQMWLSLGLSNDLADKVENKTRELMTNNSVLKRIPAVYNKMIDYYDENL